MSAASSLKALAGAELHGVLPDGQVVRAFTLDNGRGLRARFSEFGASLLSLETPDRHRRVANITLGCDDFDQWLRQPGYLGRTAGRFANRIAGGEFTLDGETHRLHVNEAPAGQPCHLHGGLRGFDQRLWRGEEIGALGQAVRFSRISPDGEEGYPGRLSIEVTYRLSDEQLIITFEAISDRATVVNLCHHSYWNLSGDPQTDILDHELTLHADRYLPVSSGLIPTGELRPVRGTPMDFTQAHRIGERIGVDNEDLLHGAGYDHCWVVNGPDGTLRPAADLYDPKSGRGMRVYTDQDGLQFYSGNQLGGAFHPRQGLCLESQSFPDAPNQPALGADPVLRPGQVYRHTVIHQFYCR